MSAVIIPFPVGAPTRAEVDAGVAAARRLASVDMDPQRRAYMMGYMDGCLKRQAPPRPGQTGR